MRRNITLQLCWLLTLAFVFSGHYTLLAQCVYNGTANAGPDVSICQGQSVTLTGTYTSLPGSDTYVFQSIPYAPQPFTGTVIANAADDAVYGPFPLGFTFCFFGNAYTQCWIGTNGWVGFSSGQPATYVATPIPNAATTVPKNCVMGPWSDWYPPGGGQIRHQSTGTSPNKRYVVTWDNVQLFNNALCPNMKGTFQIVLNETTNTVENYIADKDACANWNGSNLATQGVHNINGTVAYTVPGRNCAVWTVSTPEGNLFQPTGNPNVQVTWWNGGTQVGSGTTLTVTPSVTTTYTLRVLYLCSNTLYCDDVTVTVNPSPTASTTITQAWCNPNNNGTATVNANGGSPFTYQWNSAAGNQTTQTATGLTPGNYSVTVTNASGCTVASTANVTQVPSNISLTTSSTIAHCSPNDNGTATVNASGGTLPYTYLWDASAASQTTQTAVNLQSGTYSVTVTDQYGCNANTSVTVGGPPSVPSFAFSSITNVLCFGDSSGGVNVTVFGGTPPLTFLWSNGETTEDIDSIPAGTYSVTVTDSYGCSATDSYSVTSPSNSISASLNLTDVSCFGGNDGAADVVVNGGNGPYDYNWQNSETNSSINGLSAGNVSVTVTDANGCVAIESGVVSEPAAALNLSGTVTAVSCFGGNDGAIDLTVTGGTSPYLFNWSNFATIEDISQLTAGGYSVTVTDDNGCTATMNFSVMEPFIGISLSTVATDVGCFGGSDGAIDLTVSGGTAPYTFLWSNNQTTEDLSGIVAGSYTVTVTDNNGCTASTTTTVNEPAANMFANTTVTDVLCFGGTTGSVSLAVNGGSTPYSFNWSNSTSNPNLSNVAAGTYTVTITDANGCAITATATVNQPASALSLQASATDATCFAGNDGSASVTGSGGTPGYNYAWNNGSLLPSITGLVAGSYSVVVTDANGCTATALTTVNEPAELIFDIVNTYYILLGESALVEVVSASPGLVAYSWLPATDLDDAQIVTPTASPEVTTTYSVTVMDANGCTQTNWITVNVENPNVPFVPTAFTPNGDGINDVLYVYGTTIETMELMIYNRWGEQLFYTTTIGQGWDGSYRGQLVDPGVYVYYLRATTLGGFNYQMKGDVTLIR
jgi:gliding motility-associated-like protein